jgi:mono/diheme cytochrome c family protein
MIRSFSVIFAGALVLCLPNISRAGAADAQSFSEIAPILNKHCVTCHAGEKPPHGLRLNSYEDLMKGAKKGPVVNPEAPGNSEIVKRITGQSKPAMPPQGRPKLSDEDIQKIRNWVDAGAPR